ncbi:MAG: OmpA family protein [Termitinemataceae bacterium]|nr:MAG: OmpA family protein [Termitinemataceae bacterium]
MSFQKKWDLALLVFFLCAALWGETFEFKEKKGAKQRTISTMNEQVILNGELLYDTVILNRMTSVVKDVKGKEAQFEAVFTLAEERVVPENAKNSSATSTFSWKEEYKSVFARNNLGHLTIAKNFVMPTVRGAPVFLEKDMKVGDTWTALGMEAHDLGPTFGISELFIIPFEAKYKYLGEREWKGKKYKAISISYMAEKDTSDYFENDPRNAMKKSTGSPMRPEKVLAKSDQVILWDSNLGQPVHGEETFNLIFKMNTGDIYQFVGKAEAEIIESEEMDKKQLQRDIEKSLHDAGINDARVKTDENGVTISIENIQFEPDSAFLMNSEKQKLDKLGEILKKYPQRDIMIGGHSALAGGTEQSRMQLSQERAGAVAGYLIKNKVRARERVMVRGFGSTVPIADNKTEEGKRQNRRVEITILEN